MDTGPPLIELRGVALRFGSAAGVGPIDLALARGDRLSFVGPSGAGKSTILRLLLGLATPDSG